MLWGAIGGGIFTTLQSQNLKNLFKGKGFLANENVFSKMIAKGVDKQGIIDYFGFEGRYVGKSVKEVIGNTSVTTGDISYGDLAFDSYDKLKGTYYEEKFHSLRVKNGVELEVQTTEYGKYIKYYPEDRLGFIHQYKNQGLYPKHGNNIIGGIGFYQAQSYNLDPSMYFSAKWWHFIYKTPRRW